MLSLEWSQQQVQKVTSITLLACFNFTSSNPAGTIPPLTHHVVSTNSGNKIYIAKAIHVSGLLYAHEGLNRTLCVATASVVLSHSCTLKDALLLYYGIALIKKMLTFHFYIQSSEVQMRPGYTEMPDIAVCSRSTTIMVFPLQDPQRNSFRNWTIGADDDIAAYFRDMCTSNLTVISWGEFDLRQQRLIVLLEVAEGADSVSRVA